MNRAPSCAARRADLDEVVGPAVQQGVDQDPGEVLERAEPFGCGVIEDQAVGVTVYQHVDGAHLALGEGLAAVSHNQRTMPPEFWGYPMWICACRTSPSRSLKVRA